MQRLFIRGLYRLFRKAYLNRHRYDVNNYYNYSGQCKNNITAIGPPSAPEIQVEEISAAELELQWNEPFTWPGYPVLDYSVTREDFPGNIVEYLKSPFTISPDVPVQVSCSM